MTPTAPQAEVGNRSIVGVLRAPGLPGMSLCAACHCYGRIECFHGLGGGAFAPGQEYVTFENSSQTASTRDRYGILDLNGDRFPDLVVTDMLYGVIRVLNTGIPTGK